MKIEKCYSVSETAHLLGICKTKVYEEIRKNALPHMRIGRRIVIPKSALCEWLQAQTGRG